MSLLDRWRYRAIIEVDVIARPLNRISFQRRQRERELASLARGFPPLPPPRLPSEEELAPQRALQKEIRRDAAFLHRWMASHVVSSLWDGSVVSDDLESDHGDGILRELAARISPRARRVVLHSLEDAEHAGAVDEFWMLFETKTPGLEVNVERALPEDPDVVVGRRFRAVVPVDIHLHDLSPERIARRRAEALAALPEDADKDLIDWHSRPLPSQEELHAVRELLVAAVAMRHRLDHLLHTDVIGSIKGGILDGIGSPPLELVDLRPLIDRLPDVHRNALLRTAQDEDWTDRLWALFDSFEDETVSLSVVSVRG